MRTVTKAALLLATLICWPALPASAATIDGNAGGNDAADNGDAAAPGGATAPDLPVPEAITATRAFDEPDPAPVSDALASLSRSSDGSGRETPPSAALAAVIAAEVGNAPAERGLPTPAQAGPSNGLTKVGKTTVYPYRAVGQIYVTYGKNTYVCTGTLIGPSTVATAAGCLYGIEGKPVWADDVQFYPGANDGKAPYKPYAWKTASIMKGFADPTYTSGMGGQLPYAIGLVILDKPAGDKLGWFGFETDPNDSYAPSTITYGAGDTLDTMSTGSCTVDASLMWRSFAIPNPCPANGWGNPLYVTDPDSKALYVTGLNIWKYEDGSTGSTRINPVIYQWLADNRQ